MKLREKTTATLLIAIFMISTFAVALPVMAVDPFDSYETAIIAAADRLVETQNDDGGWDWGPPDDDPTDESASNTIGVTAQGVLDAYKLTSDPEYLPTLTAAYTLMTTNALLSEERYYRIRGPDITFLVELSEAIQNDEYADFAKVRYLALRDEKGSATGIAEFVRGVRYPSYPGLISWDINFYIQGVLALDRYFTGYFADAVAMAEVIHVSLYMATVDYDITDSSLAYYGLAVSGALEAFVTTGTHKIKASDLEARLLGIQNDDGSFGTDNIPQGTAYAVIALLKTDSLGACIEAGNYFVDTQLENGAWEGTWGEYTEVSSEAAQALYDIYCLTKADFVPGKGHGLDKPVPNDNFAKGRQ